MAEERQLVVGGFFKAVLWILGGLAIFGVAGLIFIIIRDTNKPPPNPYFAMKDMVAGMPRDGGRTIVFVARNGNIIFEGSSIEGIDSQTEMRVDGLADTFLAMAAGVLVDQNKLQFEQTLGSLLDEVPQAAASVTLLQLLDHTSGLVRGADGNLILEHEPGTLSRFSPVNYELVAEIVALRIDEPLFEFMRTAVFEPAEMTQTSLRQDENGLAWFSTAKDLFAWDQVLNTNKIASFRKVLFKLVRVKTLSDGTLGQFAGGWYIGDYRGLRLELAADFDRQFNVAMGRFPERRFVCMVLSEQPQASLDSRELISQIADIYMGREMPRRPTERDQDGTGI